MVFDLTYLRCQSPVQKMLFDVSRDIHLNVNTTKNYKKNVFISIIFLSAPSNMSKETTAFMSLIIWSPVFPEE